jgi:hypothetical protein
MRRVFIVIGALGAASLIAIGADAFAANPTGNHFNDSGTFTDNDFFGTGKTVNGTFAFKGTEWLTPNQADYRNNTEGVNTITNPANGATIILHFTGPFIVKVISFNADGGDTELDSFKGLPEQIKMANGGMLSRDAGYVQFLRTFDGDGNLVSSVPVIEKGPHPDLDSGFQLFCNVTIPALGL